jgi:alpha-aminoadipate/glutamate carrier protein LysW
VVRCPECGGVLDLEEDEVEEGEILSCPECEVELEVVGVSPVQVNALSDEDEESSNGDAEDLEEEDEEEEEEEEEEEDA